MHTLKKKFYLIILSLLTGSLMGCAHSPPVRSEKIVKDQVQRAHARRDVFLRQGATHERLGDLVAARKDYQLALTIAPASPEGQKRLKRVEDALHAKAALHCRQGRALREEGLYRDARREFLAALYLWPDDEEALKALTHRNRLYMGKYIVHMLEPGENLSSLAQRYYGDYRQFPLIAEFNHIMDVTRIRIGKRIKIPEIRGIKLNIEETPRPPQAGIKETLEPSVETLVDFWYYEAAQEDKIDEHQPDESLVYRELGLTYFKEGKYRDALNEFQKVLGATPKDPIALSHAKRAQFQIGMKFLKKNQYLLAATAFKKASQFDGDCRECMEKSRESENVFKEIHYRAGMKHFDNENLTKALEEWERVKALDPEYKRVAYLIKKVSVILKNLEEIKQDQ